MAALSIGQTLQGARGEYKLLQLLKDPSIFKAQILTSSISSFGRKEWAVAKSAVSKDEILALQREYRNYQIREIASSPYIRALRDTVDSSASQNHKCLILEWMDTDIRSVPTDEFRLRPYLLKAVSKSVLSALALFKDMGAVHTDININNVFLSDVSGKEPIAKVGDLGNLVAEGCGKKDRVQSLPCRAPEVWRGLGCDHASDVWSLGVTLADAICPRLIFGATDKIIEDHTEAWCIAKLQRLLGPLGDPANRQDYQEEFEIAEQLASMQLDETRQLIEVGTLREELERSSHPDLPKRLLDFIEFLLVVDPAQRPSARDALQHEYLQENVV